MPGVRSAVSLAMVIVFLAAGFPVAAAPPSGGGVARDPAHDAIACSRCHGGGGANLDQASAPQAGSAACAGCHSAQSATSSRDSHAFHDGRRACLDCHSFHRPEMIRAGERRFAFAYGDPDLRFRCGGCHSGAGSHESLGPGHREAAALYHVDADQLRALSSSQVCLSCHERGARVHAVSSGSVAPSFHTGATHPFGIAIGRGRGLVAMRIREHLDPRIRLSGERIECETCHDLAGRTESLLVRFERDTGLCLGCHETGGRSPGLLAAR